MSKLLLAIALVAANTSVLAADAIFRFAPPDHTRFLRTLTRTSSFALRLTWKGSLEAAEDQGSGRFDTSMIETADFTCHH